MLTVCLRHVLLIWTCVNVVVFAVRPGRALRRQERISHREDVRLSPRSFLQLFPVEVLMSLIGYECSIEMRWDEMRWEEEEEKKKQPVTRFLCNYGHIFMINAVEQVVTDCLTLTNKNYSNPMIYIYLFLYKYITSQDNYTLSLSVRIYHGDRWRNQEEVKWP